MKKLYEKSPLAFSLVWIGIYCVGMSVFDEISRKIGAESAFSAIFGAFCCIFLFFWLKKQGKLEDFGLCRPKASPKAFLFYLPLLLITSQNLWGGVGMRYGAAGTVCFIAKMLCVGFLEELIFRGFLFTALRENGVKGAAVVSGITFGLGHILNLINGSGMGVGENVVQILCAMLIGLLYVVIFLRGGSLWPCILSHGALNSLSAFSAHDGAAVSIAILCAVTAAYTAVLLKTLPKS